MQNPNITKVITARKTNAPKITNLVSPCFTKLQGITESWIYSISTYKTPDMDFLSEK
jgi:hypothetical protein